MDNIVQEFIDTINNINDMKKKSMVPKFVKNIYFSNKEDIIKNKILAMTNGNTSISVKIINDYGIVLNQTYEPFGQFKHCKRSIKVNNNSVIIVFEFNISKSENVVVSFNPVDTDGFIFNINYSLINNGKASMSFTDCDIELLIDSDNYIDGKIPLSTSDKVDYIRNISTRYIIGDITNYLYDLFKQQ